MREVDSVVARRLDSGVPLVGEVSRYIISAGGKRLRPALLLLVCGALGYQGPQRFNLAAVVEFIHNAPRLGCKTLFATHYHEMVDLQDSHPAIGNRHVEVREWKDEIIFLRKVLPGPADKSYGIQVARLAGLPMSIIERAKHILVHLEESAGMREPQPESDTDTDAPHSGRKRRKRNSTTPNGTNLPTPNPPGDMTQLSLFSDMEENNEN